ncbi:protease [Actinomadura sp. KC345]|uniref:SSI family serine proteinase inhibitor n=1 Tax=Actinomadura sp. KC345 TaxID=2530371 RepID=UPI00104BF23D|nr:SSI family serine proteinase inhibitor [Actinomadura sp. KC345]TDC58354.1 protease [Actinomadura sp. KC345]
MTMPRARIRWAAALAGMAMPTGMAVLAPAAPAQARPKEPVGAYLLMVAPQEGPVTGKTLWCGPDGGTLRSAPQACEQLESTDGQVARIPAKEGPCTLEHAPVRVSADGTWRGEPRHFARTYPNRCAAMRDTGGILFGE